MRPTDVRHRMLAVPVAIAVAGVLLAAPPAAGAGEPPSRRPSVGDALRPVVSIGSLRDLQPDVANATDNGSVALIATEHHDSARHRLVAWNLDPSSAGRTFGVHVHEGPCVSGKPDAAGDHYNTGGTPSPTTEVWLDLTITGAGTGWSHTTTPFVVPDGDANSLVIHQKPTDNSGDAGDRLACIPAPY